MSKIMRSAVALLLVLVCANTNYVAFAVMENEGNFPEPLIGEEVETVDLIEKTEKDKTTIANVVRKILSGYFQRQRNKQ